MRAVVLAALCCLSGCAGSQAMQWRTPRVEEKPVLYCETRVLDRECTPITRGQAQEILDQILHGQP